MNGVNTIIWDWNGTLLNDVDICVDSINILLKERGHNTLDINIYKSIFTFPVKDYYTKAGFDFTTEPFDEIAIKFIDIYKEKIEKSKLFGEVNNVLTYFRDKKYRQLMVSAMQNDFLNKTVSERGIAGFFEKIEGLDNHYAAGKVEIAKNLLTGLNISPAEACFIGDTIHDYEVATEVGTRCLLVASGHQSFERLKKTGCPVVNSLEELNVFFE
jgi:phosphoglycolate phosphatase